MDETGSGGGLRKENGGKLEPPTIGGGESGYTADPDRKGYNQEGHEELIAIYSKISDDALKRTWEFIKDRLEGTQLRLDLIENEMKNRGI